MIFYGNIQIPRISGNFDACVDSVYQALFPRRKGAWGRGYTGGVPVYVLCILCVLCTAWCVYRFASNSTAPS